MDPARQTFARQYVLPFMLFMLRHLCAYIYSRLPKIELKTTIPTVIDVPEVVTDMSQATGQKK